MTAHKPAIAVYFDPERDRRPASGAADRFDPRFPSPIHLAIAGFVLWAVGAFVPAAGVLIPLGMVCLLAAVVGKAIKPRSRTVYWRGRPLELGDESPWRRQLYRAFFKD